MSFKKLCFSLSFFGFLAQAGPYYYPDPFVKKGSKEGKYAVLILPPGLVTPSIYPILSASQFKNHLGLHLYPEPMGQKMSLSLSIKAQKWKCYNGPVSLQLKKSLPAAKTFDAVSLKHRFVSKNLPDLDLFYRFLVDDDDDPGPPPIPLPPGFSKLPPQSFVGSNLKKARELYKSFVVVDDDDDPGPPPIPLPPGFSKLPPQSFVGSNLKKGGFYRVVILVDDDDPGPPPIPLPPGFNKLPPEHSFGFIKKPRLETVSDFINNETRMKLLFSSCGRHLVPYKISNNSWPSYYK